MATFTFDSLKKQYSNFSYPRALVQINGKDIADNKKGLAVSDLEIEVTCGFEASLATFWIYGGYDRVATQFQFDDMKSYILLGSSVMIGLGYGSSVREVFRGFIARVNYSFREGEIPGVEITAMDVKGMMMAGNYSRQLTASYFSDAVQEILQQLVYTKMQANQIITSVNITDTPDKALAASAGGGAEGLGAGAASGGALGEGGASASDRTIEMVCESDYEFVVKAARKFNYEFFAVGGAVYFRKAKSDTEILMETGPGRGLRGYEVEYDITGQVETIEVRGVDVSKAKLITASQKLKNKLSQGSKAKPLVSKSKRVYIDPTISSQEDAGYRASYLAEDISYRLGTLEAEFIGLPELTPGRFIKLGDVGTGASNTFYVMNVRHILDSERGYITYVTGKAAQQVSAGDAAGGVSDAAGKVGGLTGGFI